MSVEVDILPIADDNEETARLADLIEGVAGEFSPFEEEDLCVAKLCAFREKDQNFVAALIRSALVDCETVLTRLASVDERYRRAAERAGSWLQSLETGN